MSKKVPFTEEQLRVLELNPYTYSVSSNRITFTLEFKKFFVDQIRNHRKTTPEVLKAAGYDPSWFAQGCKHVYLSVIKDAYTMQILAYQLSESLEIDFVLETIKSLMRNHLYEMNAEVWIHSDQGCHYTSVAFRRLLNDFRLRQSMSRRGNCWDNAPQESFFGHMKDELQPYVNTWDCFQDVKERIDDYITYYNNDRYQTTLGGMSPNEYYHYVVTGEKPSALVV